MTVTGAVCESDSIDQAFFFLRTFQKASFHSRTRKSQTGCVLRLLKLTSFSAKSQSFAKFGSTPNNGSSLYVFPMIFHFLALPQPQQGSQPEEDETPQGETAAMKLAKSKPYVYFKQKSPVSKYLSDTKPLDLSFKAKGLQPIKIKWKKDNLELFIGSRYKTFDSGRQLLVQPPFTKLDTGTYGVSACNVKGCSVKGVQVLFRGRLLSNG